MSSKLLIATIGDYDTLCDAVLQSDVEAVQHFASLHRQREYLAWRALLYAELGRKVEIGYRANGAPYIIDNDQLHIGVSHCRDLVAVIVGDKPCSVDIERRDRNFHRALSKFIGEEEQWLLDAGDDALAIAWSAKECAYKWSSGDCALSDIHIHSIDYNKGIIAYDIDGKTFDKMHFEIKPEHIVVTIG
ncbi:MAG: 4'-phosphopantetheinyl transferase superfamily protein [Alistipes sp.]|nr:4'-phosphopantetheinyl transferase superfamily protein [Alistipes sp.]